jgi:hypothetical protein
MSCIDLPDYTRLIAVDVEVTTPLAKPARQFEELLDIPPLTEQYDTEQAGLGETLIIIFMVQSTAALNNLRPRVECDGEQVLPVDIGMDEWHDWVVGGATQGICLGAWDEILQLYSLVVTLPYVFKETLKVGFYNENPDFTYTGYVAYVYKKMQ